MRTIICINGIRRATTTRSRASTVLKRSCWRSTRRTTSAIRPELGVLDREIKRVKKGRVLLIPGSEDTSGHGTTGRAKFYKDELAKLLASVPRGAP